MTKNPIGQLRGELKTSRADRLAHGRRIVERQAKIADLLSSAEAAEKELAKLVPKLREAQTRVVEFSRAVEEDRQKRCGDAIAAAA